MLIPVKNSIYNRKSNIDYNFIVAYVDDVYVHCKLYPEEPWIVTIFTHREFYENFDYNKELTTKLHNELIIKDIIE